MARLRQALAAAFVLLLGVAIPLSVVRGTEYAWSGTVIALWALISICAIAWTASSAPVRHRIPYTVVRKADLLAPGETGADHQKDFRQAAQSVLTEIDYIRGRAREVLDDGEEWDYAHPMPKSEWGQYRGVIARDLDAADLVLVYEVYKLADRVNRVTVSQELFEAVEQAADAAETALQAALERVVN